MQMDLKKDWSGKTAIISGEALKITMVSAKTNRPYSKWILPTDLEQFSVMEKQCIHLWTAYGSDTKAWVGKHIKIEKEINAKTGFSEYVFYPECETTTETVK